MVTYSCASPKQQIEQAFFLFGFTGEDCQKPQIVLIGEFFKLIQTVCTGFVLGKHKQYHSIEAFGYLVKKKCRFFQIFFG